MLWWWISGAFGVLIYIGLFVIFGLGCAQKGRWLLFVLGFFIPLVWIIGAFMSSTKTGPAISD
jgi:hypothetical protein